MAVLEIPSNVKCITSGQVPTTTTLKDGEFAFGNVGGIAKLYGNVNGIITDFTGSDSSIDADTLYPLVKSGSTENFSISKSSGKVVFAIQGGPTFNTITNEEYFYLNEVYSPKGNEEQPTTDSTRSVIISNSHNHDLIFRFTYGAIESISIKDLKPPTYYRHVVHGYASSSTGIVDFRVTFVNSKSGVVDSLTDLFRALSANASDGYPASGYFRHIAGGIITAIYPSASGHIEYLDTGTSSPTVNTLAWDDYSFTITDTVTIA